MGRLSVAEGLGLQRVQGVGWLKLLMWTQLRVGLGLGQQAGRFLKVEAGWTQVVERARPRAQNPLVLRAQAWERALRGLLGPF